MQKNYSATSRSLQLWCKHCLECLYKNILVKFHLKCSRRSNNKVFQQSAHQKVYLSDYWFCRDSYVPKGSWNHKQLKEIFWRSYQLDFCPVICLFDSGKVSTCQNGILHGICPLHRSDKTQVPHFLQLVYFQIYPETLVRSSTLDLC